MSLKHYGTVRSAVNIAKEAHRGQVDLAGEPYFGHVLRVANMMNSDLERKVAFLHDVLEDSDKVSYSDVCDEFGPEVLEAVACITRLRATDGMWSESYEQYIERVCQNQLAMRVKLADIKDHLAPERATVISPAKQAKYWTAFWRIVQQVLKENKHEDAGVEFNSGRSTTELVGEERRRNVG